MRDWQNTILTLNNISFNLAGQNRLAHAFCVDALALRIAKLNGDQDSTFVIRRTLFADQSRLGQWAKAAATWRTLGPTGRSLPRRLYRPGDAEFYYARFCFWQGSLRETHLVEAERLAAEGNNRFAIRLLHILRGDWRLEQGEWALAAASYQEAVRLTRERGTPHAGSETGLALAKYHLGQLAEPHHEAERLTQLRDPARRLLGELWLAIGEPGKAKHHALAAYRWAWADGEPYVRRYELTKTTELLERMNVEIPDLPPYDPDKDEPLPWEDDVRKAIERLRAEKEAKEQEPD
jgi:hypothetical protein